MIGTNDARASFHLVAGASCGVAALGLAAAGLAQLVEHLVDSPTGPALGGWTGLVVAVASGLFLTAGVLRLARWRLAHDTLSGLTGTALILLGGLCLPLGGFAQLFVPQADRSIVGLAIRCLATLLVMWLVLRALAGGPESARSCRPGRTLVGLSVTLCAAFLLLLVLEDLGLLGSGTIPPAIASSVMSLAWLAVGIRVAGHSQELPWARRAAPLFLGMSVAELLRGLDNGRIDTWAFSAALLCTVMAALATRSAMIDLDGAVHAEHHQLSDLSVALDSVRGQADELTVWREQLTHDARNACAGVRAAMDILQRYEGRVDPDTSQRLRLAAVEEIGYLEHLLFRSSSEPCEQFEVGELVGQVGETARALGAPVRVDSGRVHGIGRPGDVAAVLRNLLVNAQTHAPGSTVRLSVTAGEGIVRIACSDDGPGLGDVDPARVFERGHRGRTSPGSGLGLYAARELMREQGGDLTLGPGGAGATFVLTLPAATPARPIRPIRVPGQRLTSPSPTSTVGI